MKVNSQWIIGLHKIANEQNAKETISVEFQNKPMNAKNLSESEAFRNT